MGFNEASFLNFLPDVLVTTAFLVVFLTRTPRRRGLTLAIIGCAISPLVGLSWILIPSDIFYEYEHLLIWPLHGISVTKLVLWIVALHMLYRDNTEQLSSFNSGEPAA